jgi:hypothetical protein
MGLHINYSLFIYDAKHDDITDEAVAEIVKDLRNENSEAEYALDNEGNTRKGTSWYNMDEDMKAFSKKYPDCLFCMYYEDGMQDGYGKIYFLNGKSQDCPAEIVYPDFNATKLQ